ncbi:MAG: M24 family metallopeptidase [bacterium]
MNKSQLEAAKIADQVLAKLDVEAGLTEQSIASQIKFFLREYKSQPAFRIIVASGKRSAKPHGFATNKKIKTGELVMVDFGALYNGYRSDITRTFVVGQPSKKQRKIYRIVKKAQAKAIKLVKAGRVCAEIDQAARDYIVAQGFGKYFIHTTGHGIGQKVHEAPKISKRNRHRIRGGQVITIEPGIYIKGWGGVRIEDMVLVTEKGCKILTKAKK